MNLPTLELCGYCGDTPVINSDYEICSQCLVKVPDEELEEMGLI
jgi:hypothetical protein